jgi:outer membrane protein assembly factor BamD
MGKGTTVNEEKGEAMLAYGEEAKALYDKGVVKMNKDNCVEAVKLFEKIRSKYPFTSESIMAELRIADCDFQQQNYAQAAARYKEFAKNHSAHPEVDYAHFKDALSTFNRIPKDWFILPPTFERDQAATKEALSKFRAFMKSYPNSEYVQEAQSYIIKCTKQLAKHELYVAKFYLKKKKYEGALARVQTVIEDYPSSGMVPDAILIMGETYLKAGKPDQAKATFMGIVKDFPQSHQAKQAKKYLKKLD